MKQAHNRCCKCKYEWYDKPGANGIHRFCPKCGSKYWEWLNYE